MPGNKMRFQVPTKKTSRLDGWIAQGIWQWVSHRRAGDWESPSATITATKPRNIQFARAGGRCWRPETCETAWHAAVLSFEKVTQRSDKLRALRQLWRPPICLDRKYSPGGGGRGILAEAAEKCRSYIDGGRSAARPCAVRDGRTIACRRYRAAAPAPPADHQ